ncbi:Uncharacterized protein DBV15_11704, partial [Temnothorax longispinosus]
MEKTICKRVNDTDTLFLVDATQKIFEIEPETKLSHIQKFFKLYKQILWQKLAWSMQDWMDVVLFDTERRYANLTEEEHSEFTRTQSCYCELFTTVKSGMKDEMRGCLPASRRVDIRHVDIFLKIKTVLTKRRIVLITCHTPKLASDQKATSLKDLDIKLYVIGLGNNWVHDQFYKDLEMLSRKTDIDVYGMTLLVQQIKTPSKNIARLSFQVCDGLEIDLVVRTLGRKRRCLQTKSLSKATNQVLSRLKYFKSEEAYKKIDSEKLDLPFVILEEVNLETKEPIGGMKLRFTQKELHRIKHIHPPAIKIIGVKPIPDDLFKYHIKNGNNLLFFGALLNKCATQGRIMVCAFTLRINTRTILCHMIRNAELGGFYLSRIAFQGDIGDKSEALLHYDAQNCITDKQVALWKKAIDRLDVNYHPYMFKSYKLECQIQIRHR